MLTSNELFRDGLLRRQMSLAKFERDLQVQVMDLLDHTERDLRLELADRLESLVGKEFGRTTTSRLVVLQNAIKKIRQDAFDEAGVMWDGSMKDLAAAEAEYLDRHLKEISPVQIDTVLPDPVLLASIADTQPISGRILSDWLEGLQDADINRIMDAVRSGMAQGQSAQDIIRSIVGSSELDGADGALQFTRNALASLVQTSVSTIANEARQAFFEANSDVFEEEQWVATLDDATCEECGDLDGETFPIGEGDQPPIHFNCRCVRVPVISGGALGDRPANAATEDELDGLDKEDRRARIAELVGTVSATTRYSDWLGDQTDHFQDHVLGPTRAALFRDGGMKLDRFTNSRGDRYTIDQLRALEPSAFKRAGISK